MPDEYAYPYEAPEFLRGQSAEEIHRRMLDSLPQGIDKSEGNIPWDFTRPPALEKAEMVEFTLNETVKLKRRNSKTIRNVKYTNMAEENCVDYTAEKPGATAPGGHPGGVSAF